MIGPRKGPGVALEVLEKLHPQEVTRPRRVVSKRQHEVARREVRGKQTAQPAARPRREDQVVSVVTRLATFEPPAGTFTPEVEDAITCHLGARVRGAA